MKQTRTAAPKLNAAEQQQEATRKALRRRLISFARETLSRASWDARTTPHKKALLELAHDLLDARAEDRNVAP